MMRHMPAIPESTRSSIILRLLDHAEKNWPQLVKVRPDTTAASPTSPACSATASRSRCSGSATAAPPTPSASRSTHPPATATKTLSLTGLPIGSPQEALDTACTVHLTGLGHEPEP